MKLKDIVKVVPADHDTSKEADKFVKTLTIIIVAAIVTTLVIMFLSGGTL